MSKFLCWYAYKGMETEGHLNFNEPEAFEANSKAEALYKYLVWIAWQEHREPYHKSLSEHLKSEYNDGGWGFFVRQLKDDEYVSDKSFFNQYYQKFNH